MGLPKANRLKHRRDFKAVYKHGIRRQSTHLLLRALCESSSEFTQEKPASSRIGISISQKVSKKAVIRNRIKRQIRGAIREMLPNISPGWKIVVVVKPLAVECEYVHFLRELKKLLLKANLINGH